ncbi:MAG TPA: N-acetylmuramoyl-L-alanine amidase [Elusimicrobiota bacterium]|nr:N-acetylmuramoyl-L-alanine amidase [Elusimicrobiota bacterium]HMX93677.1 N-acetylmuramoyl-L-alanine amidase [Elusimicrobiota bacterium]HMZ26294.1 N-acetylmuramoyl-L-alanine amidase [Elusimicrobiota bacterium]HNA59626.1 N-acetylmuramoyl-L-alanine amidase [Elusimicrobiota bacterium]HND63775.1 N-acetylmuramoyl-L-alanine amidase [Elusimicrobiota bacterium]
MRTSKTALAVLAGVALLGAARRPPWPADSMTVVVDGETRGPASLFRIDGIACLPLEHLQKIFGGRVTWKRVSRKFDYRLENRTAEFVLDSSTAVVGGQSVALETSVRWWGDSAFLPVSLLTTPAYQSFTKAKIQWIESPPSLTVDPIPSISSARVFNYPQETRVSVELGPDVDYRLLGQRDNTLYLRLFDGRSAQSEKLTFDEGTVASVEMTPHARTTDLTVRLATGAGTPDIYTTASPRTLTIAVPKGAVWSPGRRSPPPDEEVEPVLRAPPADAPRSSLDAPYLALSPLRTIVIDAGHGGKDVGAVGPGGTYEKDVNLRTARALAQLLRAEGRFNVLLTRSDDRFLTLEERSSVANKNKADLFISLHCNAGLTRASNGFEIYYLSEKATDDEAAAVARRENAVVDLEGVAGPAKEKVEELLWSLARNEHMNDSSEIAALIAHQAAKRLPLANRGVKQAGFYVLRGTAMPAILIETGFITHPKEEGLLRSTRYHQKLIETVYAGLLDYEKRKIQTRLAQSSAGGN